MNIGVINKEIGTVSNEQGMFNLSISSDCLKDSLRFSCIGYVSKTFLVNDLKNRLAKNNVVMLDENLFVLNEVIVSNKKKKDELVGNTKRPKKISAGFKEAPLGNEVGIKIKLNRKAIYIKALNLNIINNTSKKAKFRLNFYSIKNGKPHKKITDKNIYVNIDIEKGK